MLIPNLKQWRELRGLTQVELADRSGVSPRSIAGFEAGASTRPNTARKLAEALDVDVMDLAGVDALPKGSAPPSNQPSFDELLDEARRNEWFGAYDRLAAGSSRRGKASSKRGRCTPARTPELS